jgi:hypothetical protein
MSFCIKATQMLHIEDQTIEFMSTKIQRTEHENKIDKNHAFCILVYNVGVCEVKFLMYQRNVRRRIVLSAKCPVGQMSCRLNVCRPKSVRPKVHSPNCPSAKCPLANQMSVGQMSVGQKSVRPIVRRPNVHWPNVRRPNVCRPKVRPR